MRTKNSIIISDKPIAEAIKDLFDLTETRCYVNVDFNDIESVVNVNNDAIITSVVSQGSDRVADAITKLKKSSIWNEYPMESAKTLLIKIKFSKDSNSSLWVKEIHGITKLTSFLPSTVDVKWAVSDDPSMGDKVKLIVFASGLDTI